MIQHVRVDHVTHDALTEAARASGLAYDAMLEWVVCDWAATWRNRQRQHEQHPHDDLGVVPGGD